MVQERDSEKPTAVELPEGVSVAEWALERRGWQNPRIRCFLGCIRLLDDVLESNFAILHCSPNRLQEIWKTLTSVSRTIRDDLFPLIEEGSMIPTLNDAISEVAADLQALDETVLKEVGEAPANPDSEELDSMRTVMCVTVGKLHGFLMDSLGHILDADPRSRDDADYFLSRQFARDVDDTDWLHTSVGQLEEYLARINQYRQSNLTAVADHIESQGVLPSERVWEAVEYFLDELTTNLTPKLKRIVGLRGIRIDELQIVEHSVAEIPRLCSNIQEIYEIGLETAATIIRRQEDGAWSPALGAAGEALQQVIGARMVTTMGDLDDHIRDLLAFVPLWRSNLAQRRALSFKKIGSTLADEED